MEVCFKTRELKARLIKHNRGQVKSTKGRTPFVLHYSEVFETRSGTFQREQFFKSLAGRMFLKKEGIIK